MHGLLIIWSVFFVLFDDKNMADGVISNNKQAMTNNLPSTYRYFRVA